MKTIDVAALGSCYLDINTAYFPIDENGIPAQTELVGSDYEVAPGGSAVNFCRLLQRLGQHTAFIGMIGDDQLGEVVASLLREQGVRPLLTSQPGSRTNVSFNVTGVKDTHIMLVAGTANVALAPGVVMPKLRAIIHDVNMLYLGGCFKLKAFESSFGDVATLAKQHDAKLIVDHGRIPEGADESRLEVVQTLVIQSDFYLPSREEFLQLWGVKNIEEGLRLLKRRSPQLIVVVKDGSNGAWFLDGETMRQTSTEKISNPINLTGAGDSFNAGFIAGLRAGRQLHEAIGYANKVAVAHISGDEPTVL